MHNLVQVANSLYQLLRDAKTTRLGIPLVAKQPLTQYDSIHDGHNQYRHAHLIRRWHVNCFKANIHEAKVPDPKGGIDSSMYRPGKRMISTERIFLTCSTVASFNRLTSGDIVRCISTESFFCDRIVYVSYQGRTIDHKLVRS